MSHDPLMEEFPGSEVDNQPLYKPGKESASPGGVSKDNWIISTWEGLSRIGLGETVSRWNQLAVNRLSAFSGLGNPRFLLVPSRAF